jgi:hypothetical protein
MMTDLDGKSAARGGAVLSVLVQRVRCQVRVLRDDEAGCAAGMADWRVCQGQEQAGKGRQRRAPHFAIVGTEYQPQRIFDFGATGDGREKEPDVQTTAGSS